MPKAPVSNLPLRQKEFTFIRRLLAETLRAVIGSGEQSTAARRLTELQMASPVDTTVKNLLGLLDAKLELCSRLPVYAWEAGHEGHEQVAASLKRLADTERDSIRLVVDELSGLLQRWAQDKEGET